ncbi:LacI family transcriptional regulator [Virgibacillus phasianinus]|uniref:LacI family transcriptional regulator n=1 Tax=Virgibacillus phasianinus TaxID=2017483 RepID=A0A220U2I1_9BACI|nr:substrate-binding domain-containing protein [Virgibacillus phasianinus]ASK62300.1 LacI family transcriptional regulator [Virgibacillus phasianinus]
MTKKAIYGAIVTGCIGLAVFFVFNYLVKDSFAHTESEIDYVIGVSQPNLREPWQVLMNEEIKTEVEKHNNIRVIYTDAAQSTKKQIENIQTLRSYGIDLLIVSIDDSSALSPVISDVYQDIPVIVLGRGVEGYNYTLYIGSDNYLIGEMAAESAIDLLGYKHRKNIIEIQGLPSTAQARERSNGFRNTIFKESNNVISDAIVANWQRDKAEDGLKKLLKTRNKPDLIYAHNDAMALGAYRAINSMNLSDVIIIGSDGVNKSNGGLQLVKEKKINTTFITPTGGKESIRYALDILSQEVEIPKKVILRNYEVTKKNVSHYLKGESALTKSDSDQKVNLTLGFAQVGNESEFRSANTKSIIAAAEKEGIDLIFENAENNQEKQIAIIKGFIDKGVDVIAFSPIVEYGWEEVLQEAKDAGIPVILSDREIEVEDPSLWTSFIGSDFVEEGRRAARWLVNNMRTSKEKINIIELEGTKGSAPALGRKEGFNEILRDNPNLQVLESLSGDFTFKKGKEMMKNALLRYGKDVDAVYAHNDDMAIGAIEAIEEFGLKPGNDIKVISIDATKKALYALSSEKLNFSVECNPLLGPQLMKAAMDLKQGKNIPMKVITSEETFTQEEANKEIKRRSY